MIPFILFLAAIPTPDPPVPFVVPVSIWVAYTNDSHLYSTRDDYRTAAFSGACSWLSFDYQIGTDRGPDQEKSRTTGNGQRTDELAVAGWYRASWWAMGAGTRLSENLGGQSIQNEYHRIGGDQPVREPYESRAWEPLVLGRLHFRKVYATSDWEQLAVDSTCLVEVSTHGVRSDARVRVCYGRPPGAVVLGVVVWIDRVTALSGTAANIERDRGRAAGEVGMVLDVFSISFLITNTGATWASLALRY